MNRNMSRMARWVYLGFANGLSFAVLRKERIWTRMMRTDEPVSSLFSCASALQGKGKNASVLYPRAYKFFDE